MSSGEALPPLIPGVAGSGAQYGLPQPQGETITDVELLTRDGTLSVKFHSFLLSIHSAYFTAVLKDQRREAARGPAVLRLDVSQAELEMLREFVYSGRIAEMDFERAQDVIRLADMYMLPVLAVYCEPFLADRLANENCFEMHAFALRYHCWELAKKAYNFALRNIWDVIHANDRVEFCQLDYNRLMGLLVNDRLNTPAEGCVFDVIWTWIQASPAKRLPLLASLMEAIRFGLIRAEEWSALEDYARFRSEDAYQVLVGHKNRLLLKSPLQFSLNDITLRPRIPPDVLFCIGGWSSGTPTSRMEVYDPKVNRWFDCPSVDNTPRAYHGVAVHGGYIYVIAGYDAVEYFASMRRFDPQTCSWTEASPMYTKRCYVNVAVHDGLIYAVGGYDGSHRHNTVERYDARHNQWSYIAPMHNVRSDASATFLDGKLYVAGGFDGQTVTNTVERYDPETNTWTAVREMNSPRSGVSLIAHAGYLYVLGGFDGHNRLDSMERYSPETNTWRNMPPMHSRRSNFSVAVMHDYIYVAGGYNGTTTIPDAERFDVVHERWEPIQHMLCDRSALKICVFPNLPNSHEFTFHGRHDQAPPPLPANQAGDLHFRPFRPLPRLRN